MKLFALTCANCGAALEVPAKVTHLTCEFCGTRLQVQRSGSAIYTEALDHIARTTTRIEDNTEVIKLQNELERIDREWMLQREQYMVRGKDGQLSVPTKVASIVGAGLMAVFGIFFATVAPGIGFVGIIFAVIAVAMGIYSLSKAEQYESQHREYAARRQRLLNELQLCDRER
jgi:hypothetical protein